MADMTDLATMPRAPALHVGLSKGVRIGDRMRYMVVLTPVQASPPHGLAFFTRLQALDANGDDVLPATWSDNFVTVLGDTPMELILETEATAAAVAMVTASPFNA